MNFDEHLNEKLKDEGFKKEWDKLQYEKEIINLFIEERNKQNITQEELTKRANLEDTTVLDIETGDVSPTIYDLNSMAMALGKKLVIELK
ncbi:MAG: helix-turn-helix transcriptional regulator [Clostridia bacterium]|nr:helix-turn-helix transcriptional regulator [Clostridia bacterium]